MRNEAARQLGEELKAVLQRLKELHDEERRTKGKDVDALSVAIVNLDSAIEILTE